MFIVPLHCNVTRHSVRTGFLVEHQEDIVSYQRKRVDSPPWDDFYIKYGLRRAACSDTTNIELWPHTDRLRSSAVAPKGLVPQHKQINL